MSEGNAPTLAILDPGMGNLRSVCRAWERAGASVHLVQGPSELGEPDALVFPGQGGMPHCMAALNATGFADLLRGWIGEGRPYFGICLGMQALFEHSEEGDCAALGIFPGRVRRFRLPADYKIPHMGWNAVAFTDYNDPSVRGVAPGDQFYFVHSYRVETENDAIIWGKTEYGEQFLSAVRHQKCFATQFHPEKSQVKGLQIYRNFVDLIRP